MSTGRLHSRKPLAPLAPVLGLLLGLAACSGIKPEVRRSERVLPPRIEGVAIMPLTTAPGAGMNDQDREFLRQQIRARIDTHVPIKSFDAPPNALPSIAVLNGEITHFRTEDLPGEQIYVRMVDIGASFALTYQASEDPPHPFMREFSYQKVYRAGEQVAAELFDVQNALIEFAQLVDAEFYPSTDLDRFDPVTARDEDSGEVAPVRTLMIANEHAAQLRYPLAVRFWRLALFDPNGERVPRLFKVTRLSAGLLREEGVPEDVLKVLEEEFLDAGPVDFVTFREGLRDELGGPSKFEDRIGELSLYQDARAHYNLAAAHANLARMSRAERKPDLATYHYALAWAHTRDPQYLEAWKAIQTERRLLPAGLTDVQAIKVFLSQPPPNTARHLPGPFDEKVLPPSDVRKAGMAGIIRRAGGATASEPLEPIEMQFEPVPLEPLPPQPAARQSAGQPVAPEGAAASQTGAAPAPQPSPAARAGTPRPQQPAAAPQGAAPPSR